MEKDKLINHWLESSDDDFEAMISLFETEKFHWSLFIGHLMIEKLIKAYYVKTHSDYPPYIHQLLRLAEKSNLDLDEEQKDELVTITAFNINARYDDYKMSFKKQCTPAFTAEWITKLKELRKWLKQLINQ